MRDHTLYLKDILAAIDSIDEFVAEMDLETFRIDDKTSSAVMRKLEIIGEAVKQIPDGVRQKYPAAPRCQEGDSGDSTVGGLTNRAHQTVRENFQRPAADIAA